MYFNSIGVGRLGKPLAQALINSGKATLKAVCNANFYKAQLAIEQLGCGKAVPSLADLPVAELTFITTPDDLIPLIAKQLTKERIIGQNSIVAHCSGILSAAALSPLKKLGCQLASIHPLKAFRNNANDQSPFQGCDCVIEGDEAAIEVLSSLFMHLGARIIPIKPEAKTVYHAAAVIASNYLVTLATTAIELFNEAGIPSSLAKQITTNLMASSLINIQQTEHLAEALTGPLQRGDINTLHQHLDVLSKTSTKALYSSAALATLPLTTLSNEQKRQLQVLLAGELAIIDPNNADD